MSHIHGGKRVGAGRPKGQGKYGEATRAIRVPISRIDDVLTFIEKRTAHQWPLYSSRVAAGFPSPADDFIEKHLDLNTHLIKHPASTFFVIASGESMKDAGVSSGDMLVVDKSLPAVHGKIVIAAINGELTVKRLSCQNQRVQLLPANDAYLPIDITEDQDMIIWGVVTHIIHQT
jgi:DNA polymerase V